MTTPEPTGAHGFIPVSRYVGGDAPQHGPAEPGRFHCNAPADLGMRPCTTGAAAQPYIDAPGRQYSGKAACMHHWVRGWGQP